MKRDLKSEIKVFLICSSLLFFPFSFCGNHTNAEDEVIENEKPEEKEPEETISLNISSYNLRLLTTSDTGDKAWNNRKIYAEKIIRKYDFDIFGTQELVHSQITDLLALNNNYKYVGVGRNQGTTTGEYCAIFYKKDRFEILDEGTFCSL